MKKLAMIFFIIGFGITAIYAAPSESDNLTGIWTAIVEYNNSFDTYKINITSGGRCTVKVSNDGAEQETTGKWSLNNSLFKLDAVFKNVKISYLQSINWSSILSFSADNSSFAILGRTAAVGPQERIIFFRQDGNDEEFNERVIPQIFETLCKNIPMRSRIAVVSISAANPNEAAFYLNELTLAFFNSKNYTMVERKDIETVRNELNLQLSGYVDDNAVVSIGKFIGAQVVVTGSISGINTQKQLVVKAISVLTSEIFSMAIATITK